MAGLPLLLALSAVAGTLGLLAVPSQLVPMGGAVKTVLLAALGASAPGSNALERRDDEHRRNHSVG
jgi:hypothetical protein